MRKINVVKTLPESMFVAFSGGVDSVVMADVARKRGVDVTLAFYHHGNAFADTEQAFAEEYAHNNRYKIVLSRCTDKLSGSKEKFWRDSRYSWFKSISGCVATGHNLDDAVEWYLMTALQGRGQYMTYSHANVIRPMLTTKKMHILEYAKYMNLKWLEDPSNSNESFTTRNKVRSQLVPLVQDINPGIYNIVRKRCHEKAHNIVV